MSVVATQVTGTEKQGLGYCLVVDGKIFPAKIVDPASIETPRNKLPTTHAQTKNYKSEKFEELAEPISQDISTFFDPTLAEAFELMGTAGAVKKRQIYLTLPRVPLISGETVRENGFIYLPEGYISGGSLALPLDNYMTQSVMVAGGTADPVPVKEADVIAGIPVSAVTFTPSVSLVGPIAAGTIIGKLSTAIDPAQDMSLFWGIAGTHGASFELDGHFVKAKVELTNAGGSSGVYTVTVKTSNFVGYDEDITALQYTGTFTVTVT